MSGSGWSSGGEGRAARSSGGEGRAAEVRGARRLTGEGISCVVSDAARELWTRGNVWNLETDGQEQL
eukprot:356673-Chlamydomonas_euryale.AAC.2